MVAVPLVLVLTRLPAADVFHRTTRKCVGSNWSIRQPLHKLRFVSGFPGYVGWTNIVSGSADNLPHEATRAACLGIDPGLNRTGYAVLGRPEGTVTLIEGGVLSSTSSLSLAERVHEIGTGLREVLDEFQPNSVSIEQVFSLGRNPKTALLMAHARGAILYAVAERGITLTHYTPRQIKKLLTGSGAASKEQVQRAVTRELHLDTVPEPNDVADACAVALCHLHSSRVITEV